MTHSERIKLAEKSLKGVSIGDAFGESFFRERELVLKHLAEKTVPETTWDFTDDTIMAIAVFEQLEKNKSIVQDELANAFAKNHSLDLYRGYGATARTILREIENGKQWQTVSKSVFEGMGSMGNGASMRVSPIGAYFYDDLEKVKHEAIKSAEITHSNIEGITGAIAVAISCALATQSKLTGKILPPNDFISLVIEHLPDSDTTSKIKKSLHVPYSYSIKTVESILGNGVRIMAVDTVPFSVWCSAHNLTNFENALWKGISILGDRDTICAIIGGITIMSTTDEKIPEKWLTEVEDFNESIFRT